MAKKRDPKAVDGPSYVLGDLRAVEPALEEWLKTGVADEIVGDILSLGRDAAGIVARFAEAHGHAEMSALAKKLVVLPAQVKTNLHELRTAAVASLVAEAKASAPKATALGELTAPGPAIALFDPARLQATLVKGGRPRVDLARIRAGDVVWFGVEGVPAVGATIALEAPPEGQPVVRARLRIDSGILCLARPEASDGPRLGELRLDPFRTALHEAIDRGAARLGKLKAGTYSVSAYRDGASVKVHLLTDPAADQPGPEVGLGDLITLPHPMAQGTA